MKWHFWSKTIYRRLVVFFTGIFGALLYTKVNLLGAQGLHKYPEINYMLEGKYLEEIIPNHNLFFGGLMAVGLALLVIGWKPYNNRRREGIWLNNIATGYLATVFLAYGITNLVVLRLMSYDVVLGFIISVLFYGLFIKNVIHYTKNKRIFEEEESMKRVIVPGAIALVLVLLVVISFSKTYSSVYKDVYQEYKQSYANLRYSLDSEDYDKQNYVRLTFINYFNPDGENITLEELKESVENYNNDSGSWYELWYCMNYLKDIRYLYTGDINFSDYGWSEDPDKAYLNYVILQLKANGIPSLSSASYEEIDVACEQVYEVYANQYPIVWLGDEEGEVVLNLDMANSNNIEDWTISGKDNNCLVEIGKCYEVKSVGDTEIGKTSVTQLEDGKIYHLTLYMDIPIPYKTVEEPQVEINGIEYEDIQIVGKSDYIRVTLWIITGNDQ